MLIGEEPEVRPPPVPAVMLPAPEAIVRTSQRRRRYILKQDVARYGRTPRCAACVALAAGAQRVTKPHSDECRATMDELMQRTHWCSSVCTQTGSEEARRPPERAETNEGFQTLKWSDQACPQEVAEMHPESEAHKCPREQEQRLRGVAEKLFSLGQENPCKRRQTTRGGGRGLHHDDDVPIVTATAPQTERPADAAEAHMNMGKIELISNAVWTSAKTAIELFGVSVSRFANKSTSYGIDSTLIIDLTAKRDDGQFWNLGTREDRERLEQMQQEHQTELLIGSAPCISFRTSLNPYGTKTQTVRMQDQERQHMRACIEAHKRQLIMGRHFLHEHPDASSCVCQRCENC